MKLINKIFAFAAILTIASSCGLDNVDPPKSKLTGKIVSKVDGTTAVKVQGTDEAIRLQFRQDGYDFNGAFEVFVNQEGEFSAMVFDGEYKVVHANNRGPWITDRTTDTVVMTVKGNTVINYPVMPYYLLKNETFTLAGTTLTATCDIDRVNTTSAIDKIYLVIGKTALVDFNSNLQRVEINPTEGMTAASLTMAVTEASLKNPVIYARIGLKIAGKGNSDLVYTSVFRIK